MIALLWSETDDNDGPLDCGDHKPSPELVARVTEDWDRFRTMAKGIGFDPVEALAEPLHSDCDGDPWNMVAHDFILTRNGHGAGFWEGGWHEPWGDRLTALAQGFGEIHAYMGNEDLIHAE
jgi:hypothetical protein